MSCLDKRKGGGIYIHRLKRRTFKSTSKHQRSKTKIDESIIISKSESDSRKGLKSLEKQISDEETFLTLAAGLSQKYVQLKLGKNH